MKRLITTIALVVFMPGCNIGSRKQAVANVTKTETIIIKKKPGQGPIHSLSVAGHGVIDGTAEITLILNGGQYKTEKLSDTFKFQWKGDWYNDQAEIRYIPISVSCGNLSLKYKFYD